ncbi:MAG: ADP-ribosyltransferase [Elusimicrobiales bacterium]
MICTNGFFRKTWLVFLYAVLLAAAARAQELVINAQGCLALSNGAPLSGYQAGEADFGPWRDSPAREQAVARQAMNPALRIMLPEELAAVMAYTGSIYKYINSPLWHGRLPDSPGEISTIKLLLSGINKLPDYKGGVIRADFYKLASGGNSDCATVERRAGEYRAAMAQRRPFITRGFLSASRVTNQATRRQIISESDIVLKIHALTAKSLEGISIMRNEDEVLFRPGSRFAVVKETSQEIGLKSGGRERRYQFTLHELPQ